MKQSNLIQGVHTYSKHVYTPDYYGLNARPFTVIPK